MTKTRNLEKNLLPWILPGQIIAIDLMAAAIIAVYCDSISQFALMAATSEALIGAVVAAYARKGATPTLDEEVGRRLAFHFVTVDATNVVFVKILAATGHRVGYIEDAAGNRMFCVSDYMRVLFGVALVVAMLIIVAAIKSLIEIGKIDWRRPSVPIRAVVSVASCALLCIVMGLGIALMTGYRVQPLIPLIAQVLVVFGGMIKRDAATVQDAAKTVSKTTVICMIVCLAAFALAYWQRRW